jgi:hypothetical protein
MNKIYVFGTWGARRTGAADDQPPGIKFALYFSLH